MTGVRTTTPTGTRHPPEPRSSKMTTTLKRIAITLAPLAILAATAAPRIKF